MKIILAMATSLNSMTARENGEEDWLPSEGWREFLVEAKKFDNFVMGRQTYELVTELYPDYNFDDVMISHKLIVTRNKEVASSEGYVVVHSPEEAVEYLKNQKQQRLLLIGGGKLNSEFLKRKLVDEIWLTINPYIIGKGRPVIHPEDFESEMTLIETYEMSKGRVMVKYAIKK